MRIGVDLPDLRLIPQQRVVDATVVNSRQRKHVLDKLIVCARGEVLALALKHPLVLKAAVLYNPSPTEEDVGRDYSPTDQVRRVLSKDAIVVGCVAVLDEHEIP